MGKEEGKKKGGCLKVAGVLLAVGLVLSFLGFGGGSEEGVQAVDTATIEELTELRDEAISIKEYNCADGTYEPVLASFNVVQDVLNHADEATDEEIAAAYNELAEAMNQVVSIRDAEPSEGNAIMLARSYAWANDSGAYSRAGVINSMTVVDKYPVELAEYGADNAGIDWEEEAFQCAMTYVNRHSDATYADVAAHVKDAGFTTDEIAFALVQLGFTA